MLERTPEQIVWFFEGLERDRAEQRLSYVVDTQAALASTSDNREVFDASVAHLAALRAVAGYTGKALSPSDEVLTL